MMNASLKAGLLTLGLGILVCSTDAAAAVATHTVYSNAVNYCQAFTPGISNTIRNRVIGAENVGDTPIAVACNFASVYNGAVGNSNIKAVSVFFTNGAASTASVTCTLLTGTSVGIGGAGATYSVAKFINVPAGAASSLYWTTVDNPTEAATDMGNLLLGVNCTLPKNMTLSATTISWSADNGL